MCLLELFKICTAVITTVRMQILQLFYLGIRMKMNMICTKILPVNAHKYYSELHVSSLPHIYSTFKR